MVTGLWVALEFGPDAGKQSGETWLLWQMLDQLKPGDTLVADCFYCTYWLVAACKNKGANTVMKNHHKREDNPLGARQLNQHDRTTVQPLARRCRSQWQQCPRLSSWGPNAGPLGFVQVTNNERLNLNVIA